MPHEFLHLCAFFIHHHANTIAGQQVLHFVRTLEIKLDELFFQPRVGDFFADKLRDVLILHMNLLLLDAGESFFGDIF